MARALMSDEVSRLLAAYERAEDEREEAAELERRAYIRWQEAYGAYEVARAESARARTVYLRAARG